MGGQAGNTAMMRGGRNGAATGGFAGSGMAGNPYGAMAQQNMGGMQRRGILPGNFGGGITSDGPMGGAQPPGMMGNPGGVGSEMPGNPDMAPQYTALANAMSGTKPMTRPVNYGLQPGGGLQGQAPNQWNTSGADRARMLLGGTGGPSGGMGQPMAGAPGGMQTMPAPGLPPQQFGNDVVNPMNRGPGMTPPRTFVPRG